MAYGLSIGIVGLPNVGKSTLFNTITKAHVLVANYPFATIEKNVGVVPVSDARLAALQRIFTKGSRVPPIVPSYVEFVDIAGLVRGAHQGEGLGNQFLGHVRSVAAIAHVVRCFEDPGVVHVEGKIDPLADMEIVNTELTLADLQTLERRVEKLSRSARTRKEDQATFLLLEPLLAWLAQGRPARTYQPADGQSEALGQQVRELGLLTAKPIIYVANVGEDSLPQGRDNPDVVALRARAAEEGAEIVVVSAKIEAELLELDPSEVAEYLEALGLSEAGLERLVHTGYQALGLMHFMTAGEKEIRAWTIVRGTGAPKAASEIHSDIERGFIRAEVVDWDKLVLAEGWSKAKEKGWVRTEGKEYVVRDGDVINFLFNV